MDTPELESVINVKIDADLAQRYRDAYWAVFGLGHLAKLPIEEFITRFVRDRLIEETEFVAAEASVQTK